MRIQVDPGPDPQHCEEGRKEIFVDIPLENEFFPVCFLLYCVRDGNDDIYKSEEHFENNKSVAVLIYTVHRAIHIFPCILFASHDPVP
jgi:hypothetical protein